MAADLAGTPDRAASTCSSAATPTCRTSAPTRRRSAGWCSTRTTSTRRCRAPGSGTSSGWRPASWSRASSTGIPSMRPAPVAAEVVRSYRESMAQFADQGHLSLWYDYVDVDDIGANSGLSAKELNKRLDRFRKKATRKTSQQALEKLAEVVDGRWRIRHEPPVLFPLGHLPGNEDPDLVAGGGRSQPRATTRRPSTTAGAALLDRYELVDVGVKVVGVGSVGTRCLIAAADRARRARPVVPPDQGGRPLGAGRATCRRAATSTRASGWSRASAWCRRPATSSWAGPPASSPAVHYYLRQLRDWKGSVEVEADGVTPEQLALLRRAVRHDPGTGSRPHPASGRHPRVRRARRTTLDSAIVDVRRVLRRAEPGGLRPVRAGHRGRPAGVRRARVTASA